MTKHEALPELLALAEREARWAKWPNGDAGDAIDWALGHLGDDRKKVGFLDDWRDGRDMETRWPGYIRWLNVQRDCARSKAKDHSGGGE